MEKVLFDELTTIWEQITIAVDTISKIVDKIAQMEKVIKHNESRLRLIDERLSRYTTFLGGLDPFEKAACREENNGKS